MSLDKITCRSIRAERLPGGNITIDTTHTTRGLIRQRSGRAWIEIEYADLDDAIAALQALRDASSATAHNAARKEPA